ncbi:non-ribosomal peptide synthetase [Mucilaginibacter sp. SP1R1]|uniref:non-ribosomal peptide synthetase n=1 Tax=Mucilaginibacter sp. SP1R1 TaxID=2723091 RepID=UPI00161B4A66|nr:non-ribosomal peptide synthetase [Mucilaginibacter sp. SP1R1]MBB6148311.1 amino acid adenylation domain-containing protein [Mucilaginibacter sp. SP1R1]
MTQTDLLLKQDTLLSTNITASNKLQTIDIGENLSGALIVLSKKLDVPLETIYITVFQILLQRYAGQETILLEQAFLGEWTMVNIDNGVNLHNLSLGCIAQELNSKHLLPEAFQNLQQKLSDPGNFKNLYFEKLEDTLTTDQMKEVYFKIFFLTQRYQKKPVNQDLLNFEDIITQLSDLFSNYHFGLYFQEGQAETEVALFYNGNLFSEDFFARFAKHFIILLKEIIANPEKNIGAYNIVTDDEWDHLIRKFNDTSTPYPKALTLFHLFEKQAAESPDQVALIRGDKKMTYNELNKAANQLAYHLVSCGITAQDNVGLLVSRDFEMIIGMFAILKTGGAYVPIDPDYPVERQHYIFNQSGLKAIVADQNYPLKSLIGEDNYIRIDLVDLNGYKTENLDLNISSNQLAYTIYTSGSTGKPKGVMIEHHSAVNLVTWVNTTFGVGPKDRLLFITSMCFDLSVYDIFGMLAAGGTLVITQKQEIQDVKILQRMLVTYQITIWDSVPTTMDYLVRTLELDDPEYSYDGLKTILLSGDWIPVSLPDRAKKFFPEVTVVGLGGATEGTVWSNFFIIHQTSGDWNSIPYGKPIANNFFYILNEHLQPVPQGTIGELYIGGVGVARGYAHDDAKTSLSFVPDPFHQHAGGMMYRTGDLGRMMPNYHMEFIGRKDNQVKINGFRVELGEIESVLNNSSLILDAVVIAITDKEGNKRLVAYVVTPDTAFDREAITSFLSKQLPEYMIPAIWIGLEKLPLTSNGKIDRQTLPYPENFASPQKSIPGPAGQQLPQEILTDTEEKLRKIWKECLNLDQLHVDSNFFELGGHSLIAVQILSKFRKITGLNLQLAIFFKCPTIRTLARFADENMAEYHYQYLVPIKPEGTKNPLYIVHGDGLNVLNFSPLAACIDQEQPLFGLQAVGLDGKEQPLDNLQQIAACYLKEIVRHNPEGPYLLAGYSSGGYIAMEIQKQLHAVEKKVQMLIIFDADAEKTEYKDWYSLIPKKAQRHLPRFLQSIIADPISSLLKGKMPQKPYGEPSKTESKDFYRLIKKIKRRHITAFRNYQLESFDGRLFLYKASICVHYIDYGKFLGWEKYAKKGVELCEVPGDHFSMLLPPHVRDFATILQKNLDEHGNSAAKCS